MGISTSRPSRSSAATASSLSTAARPPAATMIFTAAFVPSAMDRGSGSNPARRSAASSASRVPAPGSRVTNGSSASSAAVSGRSSRRRARRSPGAATSTIRSVRTVREARSSGTVGPSMKPRSATWPRTSATTAAEFPTVRCTGSSVCSRSRANHAGMRYSAIVWLHAMRTVWSNRRASAPVCSASIAAVTERAHSVTAAPSGVSSAPRVRRSSRSSRSCRSRWRRRELALGWEIEHARAAAEIEPRSATATRRRSDSTDGVSIA